MSRTAIESGPARTTDRTGTGTTRTRTVSAAFFSSTMISTSPVSCAVISPSSSTVTIDASLERHSVCCLCSRTCPCGFVTTASSESIWPPRAPASALGVRSRSRTSCFDAVTSSLPSAPSGAESVVVRSPRHAANASNRELERSRNRTESGAGSRARRQSRRRGRDRRVPESSARRIRAPELPPQRTARGERREAFAVRREAFAVRREAYGAS